MKGATILPVALLAILTFGGLVLALVSDDRWNPVAAACLAPSVFIALRTIMLSFVSPRSRP